MKRITWGMVSKDCTEIVIPARGIWNRTYHKLGLGVYDEKGDNRRYTGLHPHDFRRSASRNLIKAGVPRSTAIVHPENSV